MLQVLLAGVTPLMMLEWPANVWKRVLSFSALCDVDHCGLLVSGCVFSALWEQCGGRHEI